MTAGATDHDAPRPTLVVHGIVNRAKPVRATEKHHLYTADPALVPDVGCELVCAACL